MRGDNSLLLLLFFFNFFNSKIHFGFGVSCMQRIIKQDDRAMALSKVQPPQGSDTKSRFNSS